MKGKDSLVKRLAKLSDDGLYRYSLAHVWDLELPALGWIMLNPSTADATQDDATIRVVSWWTRKMGFGSFLVGNLFAYRATNPDELFTTVDPVGPENNIYINWLVQICPTVMLAWGASRRPGNREFLVLDKLLDDPNPGKFLCLGKTKDGSPRHPLYVKRTTMLQPVFL